VQPTRLVSEGNVVVTVNYRLGARSYLALSALDAVSVGRLRGVSRPQELFTLDCQG
jgi:carboxylesterase type B